MPAGCSWPGHCLGDSCRTENDCDGMMVCTNGKCANPGGSSNIPTTPSTPTVKPPTNPVNPPVNPPTNTPQGTPINSVNLRGLTPTQGRIIFQLTSLFENSTPNLQYNYIEDINDGRGYTFGYVGFCTGTGDGYPFVRDYYLPRAPNSPLRQYLPALQQLANSGSAAHTGLKDGASDSFVNIVKGLGNDGAWRAAMDAAVDAMYFAPAMSRAAALGLTSALGRGQMYDAYINHGESGVLDMIPKVGGSATGDEKGWLGRFLAVRKQVLQADSTWAESVDRVNVYQQLLNANNMDLSQTASFTVYGTRFAIVSTANGLTVQ